MEYEAYDLPQRNVIRRCQSCELRVRLTWDLKKYSVDYGLGLTDDELNKAEKDLSINHIGRKRFKKLRDEDVKVCIDDMVGKMVPVDYFYFSMNGVGQHATFQSRSSTWYQDGLNVAKGVQLWTKALIGETKMICVNKMHVEMMNAPGSVSIWDVQHEVTKKDEEKLFMTGQVRPQMRTLREMCPYVGPVELGLKHEDEIDLTLFDKYHIEKKNDECCDTRKCRVCNVEFQSLQEELAHRQTEAHAQRLDDLNSQYFREGKVYECLGCKFETKDKSAFIAHLKSEEHVAVMNRLYKGTAGDDLVVVGDFVARKLMRVITVVQQHESMVKLIGNMLNAWSEPYMQKFRMCMKRAATRMNVVAKLMDKVYDEEVIDAAQAEGNEGAAVAREQYWQAADQVVEAVATYETGVEQYNVAAGSREQAELLAVLDYSDEVCEKTWLFNMCTSCGLAFGAKLWWTRDTGTLYHPSKLMHLVSNVEAFEKKTSRRRNNKAFYRCLCEWDDLRKCMETEKEIQKGSWATAMWDYNVKTFGEDWREWPIPGCGKGFVAYANGPSMVLIIQAGDEFESIQSVRPPTVIKDAIYNYRCSQVKEVVQNLDLTMIWNWLPAAFPLDAKYADTAGFTGKKFLGINKYPLAEWKAGKRKYMSEQSWVVFAMMMAAGSEDAGMQKLMQIAIGLYEKGEDVCRDLGEKKVLSKAWYKVDGGAVVPSTAKEVLEHYPIVHPEITKSEMLERTAAGNEAPGTSSSSWGPAPAPSAVTYNPW